MFVLALCVLFVGFGSSTTEAGCFGPPKLQVCREKLELLVETVTVPQAFLKTVRDIRGDDQSLEALPLTELARDKFDASYYLENLPKEVSKSLYRASLQFMDYIDAVLIMLDCGQTEVKKLIDIESKNYPKYVAGSKLIDDFNGFAHLAARIVDEYYEL